MKKRTYRYFQIKKIIKLSKTLTGCIEFPHFGARYPDACCIEGALWDLDSYEDGLLTSGGDAPCPVCGIKQYIQNMIDDEVSIGCIVAHLKFLFTRYGTFKVVPASTNCNQVK